jgi:hypothetical protein
MTSKRSLLVVTAILAVALTSAAFAIMATDTQTCAAGFTTVPMCAADANSCQPKCGGDASKCDPNSKPAPKCGGDAPKCDPNSKPAPKCAAADPNAPKCGK